MMNAIEFLKQEHQTAILLWQRLLGRPVSESGRLRQGPPATRAVIAAPAGLC
jgi:hypothetical protein